jgi:hypothetical protein
MIGATMPPKSALSPMSRMVYTAIACLNTTLNDGLI